VLTPEAAFERFKHVGFNASLAGLRLAAVRDGSATLQMDVAKTHDNGLGVIHGSAVAALIDIAGTLAVMSADAGHRAGVMIEMNVSYLTPALLGSTVIAEARTLRTGRSLAVADIEVRTSDGAHVAHGRITKFLETSH